MKEARKGNITKEVEIIANEEHISPEKLRKMIAIGKVVIPKKISTEKQNHVELETT
ncbi:phosphomethylpyrimidine synthase ThiC [Methanobrevibacter arboriphilus]|uniref:phosphomethylpyrimidine synthase ThiC n=1 Tax=Methanobrevibacter arboriphilus TaxID=39441 RepID=UPI0021E6868D|nr:phosphomethylpyrimidine synthase ThiC [Methanobrevibacter arboriphilus]